MRDIVYKRKTYRSVTTTPVAPISISSKSTTGVAQGIETGFQVFSAVFSWLKSTLDPTDSPRVVRPAYHEQPPVFKKTAHSSQASALTKKIGESSKTSARHLKSPLGKLALVHTMALLVLFVYIAKTHPESGVFQAKNIAQTVQSAPLRNYLPNPTSQPTPQPFSEQLADVPKSNLSLNSWVTPWTINEISQHSKDYATLSAFWLTVGSDGYTMSPKADWSTWDNFKKNHTSTTQKYYLTVTGNPNDTYKALSDPTVADAHIANLLRITDQYNFSGIDLDYEGLGVENRELFTTFVRKVAGAFHAHHKLVSVCLEARIANLVPMDWQNVSVLADQVRIMAYDYHSKVTPYPGPITPVGWLKEILEYATSVIDPNKLSIALGNYGYDWVKGVKITDSWSGTGVSYDYAKALSDSKKIPIIRESMIDDRGYDTGSTPMFAYTDDSGKQHSVWFEDNQSLQAKIQLVSHYKIGGGIFFWSIGFGDKTFWDK